MWCCSEYKISIHIFLSYYFFCLIGICFSSLLHIIQAKILIYENNFLYTQVWTSSTTNNIHLTSYGRHNNLCNLMACIGKYGPDSESIYFFTSKTFFSLQIKIIYLFSDINTFVQTQNTVYIIGNYTLLGQHIT